MPIFSLNFSICTFTACSYFHHSLLIHLFCTHICSQRMPIDFKRHWLKLLIMKISKIWLYLVVVHPVICKHLCAHFHVLPVYVYICTHVTPVYTFVYTHIYTPIYAYLWLCVCTHTYTRQKSFTNMQHYLAIQIKGTTH